MLNKRARKGFTLIELLVVVTIIGILASIALPSFVGAQDKARNASVQGNVAVVRHALEAYAGDHNGSPPSVDVLKRPRKGGKKAGKKATTVTINDNDFMDGDYLPGGDLPNSPWSTEPQETLLTSIQKYNNMPTAKGVDDGEEMPAAGAPFDPPLEGAVAAEPSILNHYGAISYDASTGTTGNYVLYATGKRNHEALIAAAVTRAGGR